MGGCHTSILWLDLLAFKKWGIFSRFSELSWPLSTSSPSHESSPPAKALLYNHFPLLFYVKTNTIKNTPHSRFFTSMKSKHREMLPRKYSLETKRWINSKVNIPFYTSPKTLREVPLSVLESAKPGRTTTVPASLPYPTSAEGHAEPLQLPNSTRFRAEIQVGWRWVGRTGAALTGPPSPPSTGGALWPHPATPSTLGMHGQGGGGQDGSQAGFM